MANSDRTMSSRWTEMAVSKRKGMVEMKIQAIQRRDVVVVIIALCIVALTLAAAPPAEATDELPRANIEFLNPTSGSSLKISDKAAKDETFPLSAWVSDADAVKLVEFEISSASPLARATTIGAAVAVAPDTYELQWSVPSTLADGRYSLQAIAYGRSGAGFVELDRDEETVVLLSAAETVDITAPTRNGELGMYTPNGRPAGAIIDTVQSSANGFVRMFYTVSRPGSEPVWKPCGFEPTKKAADGVACVLAATDRATAVTAISAIANSTPYMDAQGKDTGREQPDPSADQTADAARISTYVQVPSTVTMDPGTQKLTANGQGVFPCSAPIKAIVTDQRGARIFGANVDMHASGPTNGVYFEVVSLVSKNAAPDKNHGGTENGYNCTGTPTDSTEKQGVHRVPGGLSVKHVESLLAGGTDSSGAFPFRLFSDSAGTTQVTAWVDVQDDDLFCVGEPSASATIAWGQDGDEATPAAAQADGCGNKVSRTIALEAGARRVAPGDTVGLAGAITSEVARCVDSQLVKVQARRAGSGSRFRTIARKRTTDLGVYRLRHVVRRSTIFRAIAPATSRCASARSLTTKVEVLRASQKPSG